MPRSRSTSIQSEVAWRWAFLALTAPAIWMAPPNSSSFSVRVVLPASGWEIMPKVRRLSASRLMADDMFVCINLPGIQRSGVCRWVRIRLHSGTKACRIKRWLAARTRQKSSTANAVRLRCAATISIHTVRTKSHETQRGPCICQNDNLTTYFKAVKQFAWGDCLNCRCPAAAWAAGSAGCKL